METELPKGREHPLAEMMRAMKEGLEGLAPERSADEKVQLLTAAAELYKLGAINRYEVGDLVTPGQNTDMVGAGEFHLVVELRRIHADIDALDSRPHIGGLGGDHSLAKFGATLDMRVLGLNRVGDVVAWWVAGWKYEPFYHPVPVTKAALTSPPNASARPQGLPPRQRFFVPPTPLARSDTARRATTTSGRTGRACSSPAPA